MTRSSSKYAPGQYPSGRSTSRDMLNIGMLGGGIAESLLISAVLVVDRSSHPLRTMKSLQSLLPQTYDGWECVVVCNGPVSEDLQETLQDCVTQDERIRIINLPEPLAPAEARNHGIENSRAPFIANLSSDAISEPDRFLNQLLAFQDFPDIVACGTWVRLIDEDFHIIGAKRYPETPSDIARWLPLENPTCESSMMYRRRFALYPAAYRHGAGYAHLVELTLSGHPVMNVPQFLVASCEPERPECQFGWRGMRAHMATRRRAVRLLPGWKRPFALFFIWLLPLACFMPLAMWRSVRRIRDKVLE